MIRVAHLAKDYGDGNVLSDINVTFNDHEITVIMGPSGSGKSTLLRCLNFLEVPSHGDVFFNALQLKEDPRILQEVRKNVAMVFQSFYLYDHLSAIDNCLLAQKKVLKRTDKEARFKALKALKEVGLDSLAHRYPSQLSGGQKQRVAMARSLSMDPEVILLDEPTSALDPENVKEVLITLSALAKKKRTMILVTHEIQFAEKIADRILFMDDGHIIEDQPAEAFFKHPNSLKAQSFIAQLT